ncbi:universal stress protein [Ammoniphilus sp. CFH 90114]|uniref:universal stress protein n=1 Tax=Ammoniphilus sp. CFH 90114 TaxID=2493665 RepID=UPI001F0BBFE2|nr:universal stress protein [Ammoniphilus sp. CFH 90114]
MKEAILVCVSYGRNAERLIRRGWRMAQSFQAPLYILTVDTVSYEEYQTEKQENLTVWKELAKHYQAEFFVEKKGSRTVADIIVEISRRKHVTQIVLGQTAQSRWEQITKGSIVNEILKKIDFIDLHIVSVQRELHQWEDQYEKGVRAYLQKVEDGYLLAFERTEKTDVEGIFFKDLHTDFESGLFKYIENYQTKIIKVSDGRVKDWTNIE